MNTPGPFNDLFKGFLDEAVPADEVACPHCQVGIKKSYIMNVVEQSGSSHATVAAANDAAGSSTGSGSPGLAEPVRLDVNAGPGGMTSNVYPGVSGAYAKRGEVNKGDESFLIWMGNGEDQRLADSMAQGRLGHQTESRPMDKNQSPTRNIGGTGFNR